MYSDECRKMRLRHSRSREQKSLFSGYRTPTSESTVPIGFRGRWKSEKQASSEIDAFAPELFPAGPGRLLELPATGQISLWFWIFEHFGRTTDGTIGPDALLKAIVAILRRTELRTAAEKAPSELSYVIFMD